MNWSERKIFGWSIDREGIRLMGTGAKFSMEPQTNLKIEGIQLGVLGKYKCRVDN